MTTDTNPTVLTGLVVGDKDANGKSPSITKIGGLPVSAVVEVQAIDGGFVIPRMTTAEKTSILVPCDGMMVYDTDLQAFSGRAANQWVSDFNRHDDLYASVTLDSNDVNDLTTTPVEILPALAANKAYSIAYARAILHPGNSAFISLFGGNIDLIYGGIVGGDTLLSLPFSNALVINLTSMFQEVMGTTGVTLSVASCGGKPVIATNTAGAFSGGGTSTITIEVFYSIVNF